MNQCHLMISVCTHFGPVPVGCSAYNKTFRTTESCSVALKDLRGGIISLLLPAISIFKQMPSHNINWQNTSLTKHTNKDTHLHSSVDLLFHETGKLLNVVAADWVHRLAAVRLSSEHICQLQRVFHCSFQNFTEPWRFLQGFPSNLWRF